jgi:hypothetical protein
VLLAGLVTMTTPQSSEAGPIYPITIGGFSGGTATLNAPGTLANGLAVELGSVLISGPIGTFEGYCVDLQHYITPGTYQTEIDTMSAWNNTASPPHASLGPGAASWLYNTYATSAVGNNDLRAALSLAIWDSLYNNVYNVTTANSGFWVTNASSQTYITQANLMLAALQSYQGTLPYATWLRTGNLANGYSQDFIGVIPESGPLTLLVAGALVLVLLRSRVRASGLLAWPAQF